MLIGTISPWCGIGAGRSRLTGARYKRRLRNTFGVQVGKERTMAGAEKKNPNSPDEVRKFTNGQIELVKIGGGVVGRATFQPGWKWSNDVKPIAGTELCQAPHFGYQISGRMRVVMADGSEGIRQIVGRHFRFVVVGVFRLGVRDGGSDGTGQEERG